MSVEEETSFYTISVQFCCTRVHQILIVPANLTICKLSIFRGSSSSLHNQGLWSVLQTRSLHLLSFCYTLHCQMLRPTSLLFCCINSTSNMKFFTLFLLRLFTDFLLILNSLWKPLYVETFNCVITRSLTFSDGVYNSRSGYNPMLFYFMSTWLFMTTLLSYHNSLISIVSIKLSLTPAFYCCRKFSKFCLFLRRRFKTTLYQASA